MLVRRDSPNGSNDMHVSYRPCRIGELLGNETNKKIIKNALDTKKVPHTQLFIGSAGCGKTTMARIVALGLNCEENGVGSTPCLKCRTCLSIINESNQDVREINVAQDGGKDHVKAIVQDLPFAPFSSRFKVIIFDEAHMLTDAAKNLLLKPTETGYRHVYLIFCTNHPEKLMTKIKGAGEGEAFLSRCSTHSFGRMATELIEKLLINVCEFEGLDYSEAAVKMIAEASEGVPRTALVWLNQACVEGSWSMEAVKHICGTISGTEEPKVYELFRALNCGAFKDSLNVFDEIKSVSVEALRIAMMKFFVNSLRRTDSVELCRVYSRVLDVLSSPIYEQGKPAEYQWCNCMFKVTDIISEKRV